MADFCKIPKNPVIDVLTKEKGSKFLGFLFPVNNEEEVAEELNNIKKLHHQATHHCYAYRLGFEGENFRINDDGEPSGTAGMPIYNQLLSHDLSFCLLIVVRYYGGTKLGVSGLIQAYKECAAAVLETSSSVVRHKWQKLSLQFPYTSQNEVFQWIEKYKLQIDDQQFAEDCRMWLQIRQKDAESLKRDLDNHFKIIADWDEV
ncbi:MAG: YigZ family protein [Weeksellaceae bacterium]|nr:YigZ family protein [Weeksellaceae bacterium]